MAKIKVVIYLPKTFISDNLKVSAINLRERSIGTKKKRNMEDASRQKLRTLLLLSRSKYIKSF